MNGAHLYRLDDGLAAARDLHYLRGLPSFVGWISVSGGLRVQLSSVNHPNK